MRISILFIGIIGLVNGYISVEDNRLKDEYGRERLFHGVNIVYKDKPWHPDLKVFNYQYSYCEEDMKLLRNWGFNAIRLGVMWPGVEPEFGKYDINYIKVLEKIVDDSKKYGIYVILDFHQDILARQFCGEGLPDWVFEHPLGFPLPLHLPYSKDKRGVPTREDCDKMNWISYHFTYGVSHGFQLLYGKLSDKFVEYWRFVASYFSNKTNVIGYEIINEPWAGNVFFYPYLLWPTNADRYNLQRFYDKVADGIIDIDKNHLILFQSVTWSIFGTGFTHVPGKNNSKGVLSYHAYFPPNFSTKYIFHARNKDMKRLKCGGILTEFSVGSGNISKKNEIENALDLVKQADENIQSWFIWEYKKFVPITGSNYGFFFPNGSYTEAHTLFSRPYAQAVAGRIEIMKIDTKNKIFNLSFIPDYSIKEPTIIYINNELYYPYGYILSVEPKDIKYKVIEKEKNYLYIYIQKSKSKIINIKIISKNQ